MGVGEKARGSSISGPTTGGTDGGTTGHQDVPGPDRADRAPAVTGPESATGALTGPGAPEAGTDRILTVPNGITLVRLACIPLFLWLLFGADRQTAAAVLLGGLGATD